jgi:hypothetical protein
VGIAVLLVVVRADDVDAVERQALSVHPDVLLAAYGCSSLMID